MQRDKYYWAMNYKHLAATVLGGLLVLCLSFLAQKGAKITDKKLQKILNRH